MVLSRLTMALTASMLLWSTQVFSSALEDPATAKPIPKADIVLTDPQGQQFSLKQFGGKVLLVDFWASWCGPCRESFPWMNKIQQQYRSRGLEVIAINLDEQPELAQAFLDRVPAQFRVLLDTQAQLPEAFGLIGMPSSYLIDRDGRVRAEHIGFHANRIRDYENNIEQLLNE